MVRSRFIILLLFSYNKQNIKLMPRNGRMENVMKKIILLMLAVSLVFTGCTISKEENSEKISDVDFTVVEDIDIPKEVKEVIEERKTNPFQVAYTMNEGTYIIVGYGEQATGGYSITADELYLAEDGIHVKTTLLGPDKDVTVDAKASYPYIVLKTEVTEEDVIFEP